MRLIWFQIQTVQKSKSILRLDTRVIYLGTILWLFLAPLDLLGDQCSGCLLRDPEGLVKLEIYCDSDSQPLSFPLLSSRSAAVLTTHLHTPSASAAVAMAPRGITHVLVETRGQPQVSFLRCHSPYFLLMGVGVELVHRVRTPRESRREN